MNANSFSQVNLGRFEGPSLRIKRKLPKWYFVLHVEIQLQYTQKNRKIAKLKNYSPEFFDTPKKY